MDNHEAWNPFIFGSNDQRSRSQSRGGVVHGALGSAGFCYCTLKWLQRLKIFYLLTELKWWWRGGGSMWRSVAMSSTSSRSSTGGKSGRFRSEMFVPVMQGQTDSDQASSTSWQTMHERLDERRKQWNDEVRRHRKNAGQRPTHSPPGMRKTRQCISCLPTDWLCYCHLANDL